MGRLSEYDDLEQARLSSACPLPSMRYQHLVSELGALLGELRSLGASYEDCERANRLVNNVGRSNIGAVIHDIQSQIEELRFVARRDGIDPGALFDAIELDETKENTREHDLERIQNPRRR